jgi:hypothetical protein
MTGYSYKESRLFISKEEVLKRVPEEEIFKMITGETPVEHKYAFSPFRKDNIPDCYFEWYKDTLYFVDWAEPIQKRRHRDCFNMVQDSFQVSFYRSLEIINEHFKLGLLAGHSDDSEHTLKQRVYQKGLKATPKIRKEMPFKARGFNGQGDKEYWQPYQISRSDLMTDQVFPIIWYKVFSKRLENYVLIRPSTRSYLVGNFEDRRKFYTPDKKGKGKWATNCTKNDIWGYDCLPLKGKKLIISKSYKDYRVLKNQGATVIAFQNEGMIPTQEILLDLIDRFEEIIVFFDNDRAGIEAADKLTLKINLLSPDKARIVYIKRQSRVSDPADLMKYKGKKFLTEFIAQNRLVNQDNNNLIPY